MDRRSARIQALASRIDRIEGRLGVSSTSIENSLPALPSRLAEIEEQLRVKLGGVAHDEKEAVDALWRQIDALINSLGYDTMEGAMANRVESDDYMREVVTCSASDLRTNLDVLDRLKASFGDGSVLGDVQRFQIGGDEYENIRKLEEEVQEVVGRCGRVESRVDEIVEVRGRVVGGVNNVFANNM
mmetsp:Transcript_13007/g.26561  ORF Transcript_13007/g.26561 Transcript_13007/m.26561 type:complete len:186 (-) Transcript_13007:15-572(-)